MELILVLSGLAFIVLSFILSSRQQRDFMRIQDKMMENVVNAGVVELQTLASELAAQLIAQSQQLAAEFETKVQALETDRPTQGYSPISTMPVDYQEVAPGQDGSVAEPAFEPLTGVMKSVASAGRWGERERLVREMHNLGMDADAIAKELGVGKGEVRLILDLARREDPRL